MPVRNIIKIHEELCDGCGQCIIDCAEAALEIVDGKAKLVKDLYCDGLGACLDGCPTGALEVIQREADEFDEHAVEERVAQLKVQEAQATPEPLAAAAPSACGCPSSAHMKLEGAPSPAATPGVGGNPSTLMHFPIKLGLLGPQAPFLKGADLVLLADCTAACYPDLHQKMLPNKAIVMGCPKLDDLEAHIQRLAAILAEASPRSLTVAHMEVPCCHGFVHAAAEARARAKVDIPLKRIEISRNGQINAEEEAPSRAA